MSRSSILNDVAGSGRTRPTASKSLLVLGKPWELTPVPSFEHLLLGLGDVCSGKSTLVDRLCHLSGGKSSRGHLGGGRYLLSGCSLEYRFLDVQDEETDGELSLPNTTSCGGH